MKITVLKQQLRNPERVSVFIEGKYSFSLGLDELVKYGLKQNDELTTADVKKYKQISADGKLRARALEWLLSRPRSAREFKDYLFRKKTNPELSEKLVNEFTKKGYLDDYKFSLWFVDVLQRKNKSRRAIQAELYKKGIVREITEQVLAEVGVDEEVALAELVAKKRRLTRYKNDPEKLARYLTNQGFSYHSVKQVLLPGSEEP